MTMTVILGVLHIHVHVLLGFLDVSFDLRCNVKTQFLRHG